MWNKKTKKIVAMSTLLVMMFIFQSVTCFASNTPLQKQNLDVEYDIISNSADVNDLDINEEYEECSEMIRSLGRTRAYNVGVAADYVGFNKSKSKIRAYAKTVVAGINPADPIPKWTIQVKGNLYKNGHYLSGAPSTKGAKGQGIVRSNTPYDTTAKKGNVYRFTSYHYVYDYYGKRIWNKSHERNTVF